MLHTSKRVKLLTIGAICLFVVAGFLRLVSHSDESASDIPLASSSAIIYSGLLILWAVSVDYRITQKDIRRYLVASACIMVFWFVARQAKYCFFFEIETVLRYLWYSYYIAMIFLPLLLFFTALRIGKHEIQPQNFYWSLLFVPAFILLLGVFTNDFHQLAFRFQPNFENWNQDYTRGFLFDIIAVWIVALILVSLGIIFHKCRVSNIKKSFWVPVIFFIVCIAYLLYTCTDKFIYGWKIFQVPEMFCFMIVALYESCIQTGLIPSNTSYGDFFNASTIHAVLADTDGTTTYHSKNAVFLTREQKKLSEFAPFLLDCNTRLRSKEIGGGRVYWTEDLTAVNQMNDHLTEIKEQLAEYNDLLRAEADMKKHRAQLAEKNRLYDKTAAVVLPQLKKLSALLDTAKPDDADLREKYRLACVFNAYIKRRANLELIGDKTAYMQGFELESSIRESVEYLNVYGAACSFTHHVSGELPTDTVILAYELFEDAVELALPSLSSLVVYLIVKDGSLRMRMTMDHVCTLLSAGWNKEQVGKCGGTLSVESEDNTVYVTFYTGKGGEFV